MYDGHCLGFLYELYEQRESVILSFILEDLDKIK